MCIVQIWTCVCTLLASLCVFVYLTCGLKKPILVLNIKWRLPQNSTKTTITTRSLMRRWWWLCLLRQVKVFTEYHAMISREISYVPHLVGGQITHCIVNEPCPFVHILSNIHTYYACIQSCDMNAPRRAWFMIHGSLSLNAICFIALSTFIANDAPQLILHNQNGKLTAIKW